MSLYDHIPDVYDRDPTSHQYTLMSSIQIATDDARAAVSAYFANLSLDTATGWGLNYLGENYAIPRSPGMTDFRYRALVKAMIGCRRGTIQAIQSVFAAATGLIYLTDFDVTDRQMNPAIPPFEIWIRPLLGLFGMYGRGCYPEFPTHYDGYPVESSIAGVVLDDTGWYGGLHNDHVDGIRDFWTARLLDSVRMAGTRIIYWEF
jgi:hypothetical protein